ncbi:hypothetical protein KM043_016053 [Ampulex compressa]|nr:hypothetical protein KM043_016053 [Ampulex compressa]
MYGKRILKESAKGVITCGRGIVLWDILKKRLKFQLKANVNNVLIHLQLAGRKVQQNESGRQYETEASQGYMNEDALVQHIIDDVPGEQSHRTISYTASSLQKLKKKFLIHDQIRKEANEQQEKEKTKSSKNQKCIALCAMHNQSKL